MGKSVLSTKRLTAPQRERLLASRLGIVDYDSLDIEPVEVAQKPKPGAGIIITSKNALHALDGLDPTDHPVFCVGSKTAEKLVAMGWEPEHVAKNATQLADFLTTIPQSSYYYYPCSNMRRDELPDKLKACKIPIEEHIAYKTTLVLRSFDRIFDAVLFYSPSGVIAYAKATHQQARQSKSPDRLAFCIGETTATEARKYFKEVHVAKKPSVTSVILTTIKYFNGRR